MEHDLATIQSLRCFECERFAYLDLFKGEKMFIIGIVGNEGYLCRECIDLMAGKFK